MICSLFDQLKPVIGCHHLSGLERLLKALQQHRIHAKRHRAVNARV